MAESRKKHLACDFALALFSAPLPLSAAKKGATCAATGPPSAGQLRPSTRMLNAADAPRAAILILAAVHISRPVQDCATKQRGEGRARRMPTPGGKIAAGQGAGAPERESA